MNQQEFEKKIEIFQKIEDARDQLWDRARLLIEKGFEIEAYILILATWNFARFRYFMKIFDLHRFHGVIEEISPIFKKLEGKRFERVDFTDKTLISDIKHIYTRLKQIAEQTGATKIMALKNPRLFVMWDTEIRKIYKIDNMGSADDYIQFLITMRNEFAGIKMNSVTRPLAKAIDEYNYVIADKNRERRRIRSRKSNWQ